MYKDTRQLMPKTKVTGEGKKKNPNISLLPKTFLTGGNVSWIVATAGSWSCKLSRGAAGFSFSRLADRGLWQSSSLFSKAQLKAVGTELAGPTLVHLQHLYQPVTGLRVGTEIKTISERRFGKQQCWKAPCRGSSMRNAAQGCGQLWLWGAVQRVEGETHPERRNHRCPSSTER